MLLVFPMYVGVILSGTNWTAEALGVPHVCGGDPLLHLSLQI